MLRCCLTILALLVALPLFADEAAPNQPLADLIQQLDAEKFADRQAASEALAARGKEALPVLIEAAQGKSAEAATRALEILQEHVKGSDAELRSAAKEALAKVAEGTGASAKQAGEILEPKPAPSPEIRVAPLAPGIRVLGGARAVRIAVADGGEGGLRITRKETDGVKEIEVVTGGRTIKIDEDPAKSIRVEITEKKDGKEETKKYEAKSAAELKEKHPEAHKLYEEYAQGDGGIRIEGLRFEAAPAARIRREAPAIIREPKQVTDRLEKAVQQLEESSARLKKLIEGADDADELRKAVEEIEGAQKQLEEAREHFPMR